VPLLNLKNFGHELMKSNFPSLVNLNFSTTVELHRGLYLRSNINELNVGLRSVLEDRFGVLQTVENNALESF
jgi:predicted NBD/HSP70 family sugar kinase